MAYITDLDVSINVDEEKKLRSEGFQKIPKNLKEGLVGGNSIFLWFKKGDTAPITRVQVSFNEEMAVGLKGYKKIHNNLNSGINARPLYMWYSKATGDYDVPITEIVVTVDPDSEATHLMALWERVSCDLNLGTGGKFVHAWVKRERHTHICEVTATDTYDQDLSMFSKGYTRVDVNTNMGAEGGAEVFIWYRKTINEELGLSGLDISTSPEQAADLEKKGFKKVMVNLNEKTAGNDVYLWFGKSPRQDLNQFPGLVLLRDTSAVEVYKKEGVTVVERNLNTGNQGDIIYMCFALLLLER